MAHNEHCVIQLTEHTATDVILCLTQETQTQIQNYSPTHLIWQLILFIILYVTQETQSQIQKVILQCKKWMYICCTMVFVFLVTNTKRGASKCDTINVSCVNVQYYMYNNFHQGKKGQRFTKMIYHYILCVSIHIRLLCE